MVGYKQTDIGLIPVDWEVKKLGNIGVFKKGKGIRKDEVETNGLPCVRYGELYTHHKEYVKSFNSHINSETAKNSQLIKKNDILFAGSGETKEEIGKCAALIDEIEAYAGGDVIILSPLKCDSLFLGFLLNSQIISRQKAQQAQGDAVVHIYPSNLANIQIPLPPLPEQVAIAEVLSDTDALIIALEKRIAKKRNIKQGAMQKLLTPQDDWEVNKLGEILKVQAGYSFKSEFFSKTGIPIVRISNITNLTIDFKNIVYYPKEYSIPGNFIIKYNDILIAMSGATTGKVGLYKKSEISYQNQRVGNFKLNCNSVIKIYIYYLLNSFLFSENLKKELEQGAQPNISSRQLENMEFSFPKTTEEQKRIATILSDMDNEIDALEKKLSKTKNLKQGLMQQLLTGKIRLV